MMSLTITAITTDATEPVHTHLRNLPTGTVAIFAPRNTQPITIAKHVDDTWRGYAGDRPITITNSDIYSRNGSFTIFNMWFTQDDKDDIAEQAVAYYRAADAYREYVQGTMQYFKDAMAASTTLALITEVHRLVHQDSNMGALLRELRDSEEGQELAVYPDFPKMFSFVANFECRANSAKDALLDSASDTLRKAMAPYNRDAVTLMLIRFFKRDTDEHGNLVYDNHYFNLRNLPTPHDVELNNNMRASESKFCTVDTMPTRHFYVEARERLSKAISRATKNMSSRIKNA